MPDLPRPFLGKEEVLDRLEMLGFEVDHNQEMLVDSREGRMMFQALQDLIAGAIAEWSDARPEGDEETWEGYNEELQTWAQEWLVG